MTTTQQPEGVAQPQGRAISPSLLRCSTSAPHPMHDWEIHHGSGGVGRCPGVPMIEPMGDVAEREALRMVIRQWEGYAGSDHPSYLNGAARALLALRQVRAEAHHPAASTPAIDAAERAEVIELMTAAVWPGGKWSAEMETAYDALAAAGLLAAADQPVEPAALRAKP